MEKVTYSVPLQPVQVRLELSALCPARCAPCHKALMTREQGFMAFALLEKCLENIRQFPSPLTEVVPQGWGECFTHPRWEQALNLIALRLPKTRLVLPTNGVLLTDSTVETLAQVPTLKLVNFSVNAALAATYEAYTGLPAKNLETIEKAAMKLRQLRPDIVQWFSMVRDSRFQSPREVELFQEKWSRFGTVQISQAEYAGWPGREPITPVSLPCRSLFSDLAILYDGTALSCCYVADKVAELIVGDATKMSLLDCWHSRAFNELRGKHREGRRAEISLCCSCTFA